MSCRITRPSASRNLDTRAMSTDTLGPRSLARRSRKMLFWVVCVYVGGWGWWWWWGGGLVRMGWELGQALAEDAGVRVCVYVCVCVCGG